MTANNTVIAGEVAFAYNGKNGHPWHGLGREYQGYMDIEVALKESLSDDLVEPATLLTYESGARFITHEGETYVRVADLEEVEDKVGIKSDRYGTMGVASPDYEIIQRRELLQLAYEIEGLSEGNAHIDTIGNLGDKAKKFFVYIKVPDLVIDPNGIADTIERGVVAATSFDGSLPNMLWDSFIRPVCENTLTAAIGQGRNFIKARHTLNAEERMKQAAVALGKVGVMDKLMTERAEKMLRVDGDKALSKVLDEMWPLKDDLPVATKSRREGERMIVQTLYSGPSNTASKLVGENGYGVYQAYTEFADHRRNVRGDVNGTRRAMAAVLPGKVMDNKAKVANLILALA
jgi:phage/plasmid-like protein (TIGR03299 family)